MKEVISSNIPINNLKVSDAGRDHVLSIYESRSGTVICNFDCYRPELAKVMAAGPELFEALEMVQSMLVAGELVRDISQDHKSNFAEKMLDFVPRLNKIMLALAKARGEL